MSTAIGLLPDIAKYDREEMTYLITCLLTHADARAAENDNSGLSVAQLATQTLGKADFDTWIEIHWPKDVSQGCMLEDNVPDCIEQGLLHKHCCASCQTYTTLKNRWDEREAGRPHDKAPASDAEPEL